MFDICKHYLTMRNNLNLFLSVIKYLPMEKAIVTNKIDELISSDSFSRCNKKVLNDSVDISENELFLKYPDILNILLADRSSKKTIKWGTNNYARYGKGYLENDYIKSELIVGKYKNIIKPRTAKSKTEQKNRSKEMAEVFTPSWMCNKQNNEIDNAWFGFVGSFNTETDVGWIRSDKVVFKEKTFIDYVSDIRMEITCGEAPYLTSRYDTTNGKIIDVQDRIGLLDRKLRVICENVENKEEWEKLAIISFQSVYGFDYQGDNVLIARENLLYTFIDFYNFKFGTNPSIDLISQIATILSWNIFQMDGLKFVVPNSCHSEEKAQLSLFPEFEEEPDLCPGCKKNDFRLHNGVYCLVKDWKLNKNIRFVDLIKEY